MLVKWTGEGENTIPHNASHTCGVGCLVITGDRKVLLVKEKSGKGELEIYLRGWLSDHNRTGDIKVLLVEEESGKRRT